MINQEAHKKFRKYFKALFTEVFNKTHLKRIKKHLIRKTRIASDYIATPIDGCKNNDGCEGMCPAMMAISMKARRTPGTAFIQSPEEDLYDTLVNTDIKGMEAFEFQTALENSKEKDIRVALKYACDKAGV